MPADYTLRAIPLSAGQAPILLEYMPDGFRIGRWISIVAAAASWSRSDYSEKCKVQSEK